MGLRRTDTLARHHSRSCPTQATGWATNAAAVPQHERAAVRSRRCRQLASAPNERSSDSCRTC